MSSLTLNLDPPYERLFPRRHLFTPGDKVAGRVILNLREHTNIDRITLDFKGKCFVRDGDGDNECAHTEVMFANTKELFRGPFKLQAAVYEYPFEFHFPEKFEFKSRWPENGGYDAQRGLLPLPPSYEPLWGVRDTQLFSIYYHLKVKIPRNFADWEDKITLHFTPYRRDFHPAPNPKRSKDNTIFYRNYKLNLEGTPRPLSRTEALKRTFHAMSGQTFGFNFSAVAPTAIIQGRPYAIEVKVVPTTEAWENSPEVRLKHYDLVFKSLTSVRVPSRSGTSESAASRTVDHQISAGILNIAIAPNKAVKLTGMFTRKLAQQSVPTFTSFAARVSYGLKLKMIISCLGEESTFKIKWPNVKVYASRMEPGVEEAMRAIEDGSMALEGETGLPSYSGETEAMEELPAYRR